jgi:hypothetical protein
LGGAATAYKVLDWYEALSEARYAIANTIAMNDIKTVAMRVCIEQNSQGACAMAHRAEHQGVECAVKAGADIENLGGQSPVEALKTGLEKIGR